MTSSISSNYSYRFDILAIKKLTSMMGRKIEKTMNRIHSSELKSSCSKLTSPCTKKKYDYKNTTIDVPSSFALVIITELPSITNPIIISNEAAEKVTEISMSITFLKVLNILKKDMHL